MLSVGNVGTGFNTNVSNNFNERTHKRIPFVTGLYLRRLFNSSTYNRRVETVNVSHKGLQVICGVSLEVGAELEVSNLSRSVRVIAVVKHSTLNSDGKYVIGLSIIEKKTSWLVQEPLTITNCNSNFSNLNC